MTSEAKSGMVLEKSEKARRVTVLVVREIESPHVMTDLPGFTGGDDGADRQRGRQTEGQTDRGADREGARARDRRRETRNRRRDGRGERETEG